MDSWDELRTAYWVARLGTVSSAAEQLGVHRATVVRHVDALEAELGVKLFLRHARGYVPTEAGQDLLRVARSVDEQFQHLAGRARGRAAEVSGEIVITSVPIVASRLMKALSAFRAAHPEVVVQYASSWRVFSLEYGEAHVAVRVGKRPDHPDNVVRHFGALRSGVYAHSDYLDRRGWPDGDFAGHTFVTEGAGNATVERWRRDLAPASLVGFSSADVHINLEAVRSGLGLGILPEGMARGAGDLVEVVAPRPDWDVPLWLVTHVDLHWTPKVQAVLQALANDA